MIGTNPIPDTINYAPDGTKCRPTQAQAEAGLLPLSAIPAQQWNALWADDNEAVRCVKYAAGVLISEINTVLSSVGITPSASCSNQLYTAINCIRAAVGTAVKAGSVKSSPTPGEVSINPVTGIMTANCVGNALYLNTANKVLVYAVNELKTSYDTSLGNAYSYISSLESGKANNYHAWAGAEYGLGDYSNFGHLKISDTVNAYQGTGWEQRLAASQYAIWLSYYTIVTRVPLTNAAPQGLGNAASAGSSGEAARGDHVHPQNFTSVACAWALRFDASNPLGSCSADVTSGTGPFWAQCLLNHVYVCYSGAGSSCLGTLAQYLRCYGECDFSGGAWLYAQPTSGPHRMFTDPGWSVCVCGFTQQAHICSTYSCSCREPSPLIIVADGWVPQGTWCIYPGSTWGGYGVICGTFLPNNKDWAGNCSVPQGYIIL